jgi:hypothetical protein
LTTSIEKVKVLGWDLAGHHPLSELVEQMMDHGSVMMSKGDEHSGYKYSCYWILPHGTILGRGNTPFEATMDCIIRSNLKKGT